MSQQHTSSLNRLEYAITLVRYHVFFANTNDESRTNNLSRTLPKELKSLSITEGRPFYTNTKQAVAAIIERINIEEYEKSLSDLLSELHDTYDRKDTESRRVFMNRLYSAFNSLCNISWPHSWGVAFNSAEITVEWKQILDQKVREVIDQKDFIVENNSLEYYEDFLHALTLPATDGEDKRAYNVICYFDSAIEK